MKVSQTLLQHKLLLHRTQEAGKEQGAQRPEVSGHKLKKAWLQTQAHQCKPCSTTGQKRGSANQMVKTTAQFVVTMKPGDRWFTDHNETIHKSALLRAGGEHPPHGFGLCRPSPQWVRAHSRRVLTLRPASQHCRFLGKTHTARAAWPEPAEKWKTLPRKHNQQFGRETFTASCGAKPRLALGSSNKSEHAFTTRGCRHTTPWQRENQNTS